MCNHLPTKPTEPTKLFKHDPMLCQALNEYFGDAKAWGKANISHIKTVILAGSKSE